ncbi:MAG: thioredoxin family protein [Verrucomicrobiota bacterium]
MKRTWMAFLTAGLLAGILATATAQTKTPATGTNAAAVKPAKAPLPKLLDLGAGKCIPCKIMAPILEEMKKEYAGTLEVEFIDVWKNPDAGKQYKIEVIPTQIFYDATGKELFRHIGFYSKADILTKWKELGVELKTGK